MIAAAARKCAICGKPGNCYGFAAALRMLGVKGTHAHAHCVSALKRKPIGNR